jgi:D-methionine transport system substrate-binding protein
MKTFGTIPLALLLAAAVLANAADPKEIRFGVAPGPYGDLITQAIKPGLEQKGYKVSLVQFQDYVQPNLALGNKETEANLFQHQLYLDKFAKDHNLQLSSVINVPTAGLGIYSSKIKSLKDLKNGDEVTLSQDPTNLARGLRFLQKVGLIKLKAEIDPTKVTERDVAENPHALRFTLLEAAQIPRSLGSVTIAVVNGNFAIAAGLKLSDALALETLDENIKNVIAVRTEDLNKQYVKDIKEIVESAAFQKVASDPKNIFSSFQVPEWYAKKWSAKK